MKDIFGNTEPVALEDNEEWFNGNIIRKIKKPVFSKYIVYRDILDDMFCVAVQTREDAIEYCLRNPIENPDTVYGTKNPRQDNL